MSRKKVRLKLRLENLEDRAVPDANSAGVLGIQSTGLGLTGKDIYIGQVENSRSTADKIDGADHDVNYHQHVHPEGVYYVNAPAKPGGNRGPHATAVAGVIIATGKVESEGIAKDAKLLSAASGDAVKHPEYGEGVDPITYQYVAKQNNGGNKIGVPAINLSYTIPSTHRALDGGSLASRAVDYFSWKHNTLFVIAPSNTTQGHRPADAFNGLTVAAAMQAKAGEPFDRAEPILAAKTEGVGGRRLTHLIAPGKKINVPKYRPGFTGANYEDQNGNSFAAPHATAAVALLQEHVWSKSGWGQAEKDAARRHELMKAVLINSADKVKDVLGMTRTVQDTKGKTWNDSDARDDPTANSVDGRKNPLAKDFGAGFLNASRALDQLKGGRQLPFLTNFVPPGGPTQPTPLLEAVGWDVNTIEKTGVDAVYNRYRLPILKGGGWISATLTWDRLLKLQEDPKKKNDEYDAGKDISEDFIDPTMSNLDLYLMETGETDITKNKWSSESDLYNLEHFLFNLPAGNRGYELWVKQNTAGKANYALAWWADKVTVPSNKGIKGLRWRELNPPDGVRQPFETSPMPSLRVQLWDQATNTLVDTRWTDADGKYAFESVDPGTYYITFEAPYQYAFTTPNAGSDDAVDSDAVPAGGSSQIGQTGPIVVSSQDVENVDVGFVGLTYGSIGDFVWDDLNGDGDQDDGTQSSPEPGLEGVQVDLYTADDEYVATEWTAADGSYNFADVAPGSYYLVFGGRSQYAFSPQGQGGDSALDSDADPATGQTGDFSLGLGQTRTDLDAGLHLVGGSVGDRVWYDMDGDGLQGPDESGVGELPVRLYTASGTLVAETETDQDGYYAFPTVAPGSYYVQFERPPGSAFTAPGAGPDEDDSDVTDPVAGQTSTFSLSLGEEKNTVDAGVLFARVGDRVWADVDLDGVQDSGEPGRGGVVVRLLDDQGAVMDTTVTDSLGDYSFWSVEPGAYRVQVVAPGGSGFSPADQGGDDTLDSDVDPAGLTPLFSVTAGAVRTDLDAGLEPTGAVGDRVWADRTPTACRTRTNRAWPT
jgi:hypothetical protein